MQDKPHSLTSRLTLLEDVKHFVHHWNLLELYISLFHRYAEFHPRIADHSGVMWADHETQEMMGESEIWFLLLD